MSLTAAPRPERQADPWSQATGDRGRPRPAPRRLLPPKGWYPDPPVLRFWDGGAWTALTRPAGPPLEEELVHDGTDSELPVRLDAAVTGPMASIGTLPLRQPDAEPAALTALTPRVGEAKQERPALRGQLLMFLWVALLALGAGAVVATLGIVLTV
jgi:hypothetical protein